jgi:hypothetical protein
VRITAQAKAKRVRKVERKPGITNDITQAMAIELIPSAKTAGVLISSEANTLVLIKKLIPVVIKAYSKTRLNGLESNRVKVSKLSTNVDTNLINK